MKTSHMKYGLFFLMIFMMITAVKVYLNYANIQQNITDVRARIEQRKKDMQYLTVQNAYLDSVYAEKIMAHQQGILLPGEQFILFEYNDPEAQNTAVAGSGDNITWENQHASTGTSLAPFASRREYLQNKIDSIP